MRVRVTALSAVLVVLFALVLGQAVLVQVHRAAALNAAPGNPRNQDASRLFPRGEILASNGIVLARSVPRDSKTYPYRRDYPLGALTSAIVGYDSTLYGTTGIEYQYDQYLTAHPQTPHSLGQWLDPNANRSTDNVQLTLEIALQQVAARALAGRDGAVVALDPRNGAVLAMFSNPNYDPTPLTVLSPAIQTAARKRYIKPNQHGFKPLLPVATGETFPPGSTFKVVTTAAVYRYWPALADKSYGPYSCLPLAQWGSTLCLQNSGGSACGGTIAVMLPESCDPGYANIGFDLGAQTLFDQATQFGYNSVPPLDLPGVTKSVFPPPSYFSNHLPVTGYAAIGQDNVRATALQDALVAAGIANHGTILVPHLLRSVTDALGDHIFTARNRVWRQPINAAQAAQIVPLMQGVVQYGTAAGVGFLYQDDVAAKTGTAQTGVGNTNTDDWMIAFAPATKPVVAVAVVVPYQSLSAWGATVAGPIVKCVIEAQLAIDAGQPPAGTATTCPKS